MVSLCIGASDWFAYRLPKCRNMMKRQRGSAISDASRFLQRALLAQTDLASARKFSSHRPPYYSERGEKNLGHSSWDGVGEKHLFSALRAMQLRFKRDAVLIDMPGLTKTFLPPQPHPFPSTQTMSLFETWNWVSSIKCHGAEILAYMIYLGAA